MLPLDDPRWRTFKGGYRVTYDASAVLRHLIFDGPDESVWQELWDELHHQGDLDQASYAAVPWIVESIRRSQKIDWNPLAMIATIELERVGHDNPPVNAELEADYFSAVHSLPEVLGTHSDHEWSELVVQFAVACIALARGQRWLARAYFELDRGTAGEWFSREFGWEILES
jgi:hypothetical protein